MIVLEIADIKVEVVKKDIKNIHLAVYPPNGKVTLASPSDVSDDTIRLFVISKLAWIRKQQRAFATQDRQSLRNYIDRESHYFLGKRYLLKVIEEAKPAKVILKTKNYIELHIRPDIAIEQRKSIMNEWYRNELKQIIPPLLQKWEKEMGVSVEFWGVKQMKTKWGACDVEAKRIWFNLELAKKPIYCLEYIIVHELTHLLERLHNDRFLAFMNKYLPKWKQYREELNRLPISHADWDY